MERKIATLDQLKTIASLETSLSPERLAEKILTGRVYLFEVEGISVGLLRYGFFWDSIPFVNLLAFKKDKRGQGYGTQAMRLWEEDMQLLGHTRVMTSTLAEEDAQHFYRKLGYLDCGCLLLPEETTELFFYKNLPETE